MIGVTKVDTAARNTRMSINSVMKNRKRLCLSGLGFRKLACGIYPQKPGPDNVLIHVIQG